MQSMAKSLSIPQMQTIAPASNGPLSSSTRLPPVKPLFSPIEQKPVSTAASVPGVNRRPTMSCTANSSLGLCSCPKCDSIRGLRDELQSARLEISRLQNRLHQSADATFSPCSQLLLDNPNMVVVNSTACFCSDCRHAAAGSMSLLPDCETTF